MALHRNFILLSIGKTYARKQKLSVIFFVLKPEKLTLQQKEL
jgi:hypothetical protein